MSWQDPYRRVCDRLRACTPLLVLTLSVVAVSVVPASAQYRRAARHTSPPSAAERGALTVKSLSAVGDGSIGLVLTATFAGDVERYLGQGRLAHAALSLALIRTSSTQPVIGLLDEGGGDRREPVPVLGGPGQRARAGAVTVVMPDSTSPRLTVSGWRKILTARASSHASLPLPAVLTCPPSPPWPFDPTEATSAT